MSDTQLTATILITSKDRANLCENALRSAMSQNYECEIIVVDDGSSDDTAIRSKSVCPEARVFRNERPLGIIAARNKAFEVAQGQIVFTLDDDAVFSGPSLVGSVVKEFSPPCVGAVTIPIIDHLPDGTVRQRLPIENSTTDFPCVANFSGGANALRKDLFMKVGRYSGKSRQGEERGVCLRFLQEGFLVRVAAEHHIDHYPQPATGNRGLIDYYNVRNSIAFAKDFFPFPDRQIHVLGTIASHLMASLPRGRGMQVIRGACAELVFGRGIDYPRVARKTCRAWRAMSKRTCWRFSELRSFLKSCEIQLTGSE